MQLDMDAYIALAFFVMLIGITLGLFAWVLTRKSK